MSKHAIIQLATIINGLAKRSRPVHGARAKLAYDLTALLSCARPCVMLDYIRLDLETLVQLVLRINVTEALQARWCVLTHNGCHYIANHPGLLQHLGLLLSSEKQNSLSAHECQDLTPALIGFSESGRLELNLLGTDHVQAVLRRLECLSQDLCSNPGVNLLADAEGKVGNVVVIDLAPTVGHLALPTLNGLLLAYPVVYVVEGDMHAAAQASRCLSSTDLIQFRMMAAPPPELSALMAHPGDVQEARSKKRGKAVEIKGGLANMVCAFTVPACLCSQQDNSVTASIEAWATRTKSALEASHLGWSGLLCERLAIGTCSVCL